MTKKDYELIAGSLGYTDKWTGKAIRRDLYKILCENLANTLSRDNPKFDRNKFLTACGVKEATEIQLDYIRKAGGTQFLD